MQPGISKSGRQLVRRPDWQGSMRICHQGRSTTSAGASGMEHGTLPTECTAMRAMLSKTWSAGSSIGRQRMTSKSSDLPSLMMCDGWAGTLLNGQPMYARGISFGLTKATRGPSAMQSTSCTRPPCDIACGVMRRLNVTGGPPVPERHQDIQTMNQMIGGYDTC